MKRFHVQHICKGALASVLIATFVLLPVSERGHVQEANAQRAVVVVGGSGTIQQTITAAQSIISATESVIQSGYALEDWVKEYVLDPLMWGLANTVITNMLTELTRWVNSGFQGDPAFITDLEGFLLDVADQTAGEFIYGSELSFLCSPFELDVRLALSIQYETSVRDYQPQCTLSQIEGNIDNFLQGTFREGGWEAWFELTQGRYNDANKAYIESQYRLLERIQDTGDTTLTEAAANGFFLNVEFCGTDLIVDTGELGEDTIPERDCQTGTLGNVVQDQFNHMLGLPADRLAFADEFNELVSALLSQVINQAITGINGILGLGGNSSFSDNSFGFGGGSSYLQALDQDAETQELGRAENAIANSLVVQENLLSLQDDIIAAVEGVEASIASGQSAYPGCFDYSLPSALDEARDEAEQTTEETEAAILLLTQLNDSYQNAATTQERLDIMSTFRELQLSGIVVQEIAVVETELFIEYELTPAVSSAQSGIQSERNRCQQILNNQNNNTSNTS